MILRYGLLFVQMMLLVTDNLFEISSFISPISFALFIAICIDIYLRNFPEFAKYLFVNLGLIFGVTSSLLIDLNPDIYLFEINKYTKAIGVTSLVGFYTSFIMIALNKKSRQIKIGINTVVYSKLEFKLLVNLINVLLVCLIVGFYGLFETYGYPILLGIARVQYINSLPEFAQNLYIFLSMGVFYSGYMYSKSSNKMYILYLLAVISIRVISLQKFTEIFIDLSLFFTFIFLRSKRNRFIELCIPFLLVLSLVFSLTTYNLASNVLIGRFMAQSQLSFIIYKNYEMILPRFSELPNEFSNFWGDNEERLESFSRGEFYGIFKLMDLAETGRNLLYQAKENTSSSGSIPIIFIYYFGYFLSIPILFYITIFLRYFTDLFYQVIISGNNLVLLLFSSLIFIRMYKFFIIGSPSYLFNKQFVVYFFVALCLCFIKPIFFRFSVDQPSNTQTKPV